MESYSTPFGFVFGPVEITRLCSDEKKGWVVISLQTDKMKDKRMQIYVTKTGKVRIHDHNGKELK